MGRRKAMPQQEKSREEAKQQLGKALDIFLSFTAEEWEEIKRTIQEDLELRRLTEQAVSKLREIVSD